MIWFRLHKNLICTLYLYKPHHIPAVLCQYLVEDDMHAFSSCSIDVEILWYWRRPMLVQTIFIIACNLQNGCLVA